MSILKKVKNLHELTMQSMRTYSDRALYMKSYEYTIKFYEYFRNKYHEWHQNGVLSYRNCPICSCEHVKPILDRDNLDCSKYSRCLKCGFVYTNPVPKEDSYNDIYITGFGGLDSWWERQKELLGATEDTLCISYEPLNTIRKRKKSGLFLDFGCGTGFALQMAQDSYEVYGIDLDNSRIEKAKERLKGIGGDRIIRYADIDRFDFREKFDVIHCNNALEHLLEPKRYLKKFYEWLKPGGILYVCSPASDSFAFYFLGEINSMAGLGHVSLFSKKSMFYILRLLGFKKIGFKHCYIDVNATEFWKRILNINFLHRHIYIKNNIIFFIFYPLMFVTTAALNILCRTGLLKGNYFYVLAQKPMRS